MEATLEENPDPTPTKSIDSNDIMQAAVQTFEALVSTTLGTDSDGTLDTSLINLEIEQVQNSNPDRRQGVNRSSKENWNLSKFLPRAVALLLNGCLKDNRRENNR